MKDCKYIFLLLFFYSTLSWAVSEERRPNILFILTDDQRWDTLGCYGNETIKTPHLDKLASQGARLDAFYVAQPLCCPSRAIFLTGLYPHQTGINVNHEKADVPKGTKTVADYLNSAGYKTGFVGKSHLGSDPRNWGFQSCPVYLERGESDHANPKLTRGGKRETIPGFITTIFVDAAIEFIQSNKSQPWFLWLATTAPHEPYIKKNSKYAYDPSKLNPPPGWPTPFKFMPNLWKDYYATITMMDAEIGRVLTKLDELQLTDRTVVIMASDNGFMFGSHNIKEKDAWYEGSVRVPAIVRWPGRIRNGGKIASPLSSVDFLPTLIEIAAGVPPKNIEGSSMLPALISGRPSRSEIFSESKNWQMVKKGPWKYVKETGKELLYELQEDPFELTNILKENPNHEMAIQMRSILSRWLEQTPALPGAFVVQKKEKQHKKSPKKPKS